MRGRGRPPGSKNHDHVDILSMLAHEAYKISGIKNYDPLKEILRLVLNPESKLNDRERMLGHQILCDYTHTKHKAVQVTAEVNVSHESALDELEFAEFETKTTKPALQ